MQQPITKITLTGDLGSGKSTVSRILCEHTGFEYVSTGRPVLGVGPTEGDVSRVLDSAPHAVVDRPSLVVQRERIKAMFNAPTSEPDPRWSRAATCEQVVQALNVL